VRVFPAPRYEPGYSGPRTDFRETIHWASDVRTGDDGTARGFSRDHPLGKRRAHG
jgi:hypothetical protein